MMKKHLQSVAALLLVSACTVALAESAPKAPAGQLQRGRYLVQIGGCNDCHTPGYAQQNGKVDEKLWLTGDALGWTGPWGTTYPTNLRLLLAGMSEQQWLQHARRMEPRPPMPWFNVRAMTDADLKAIYAYTRSLVAAGVAAPGYAPPGTKVSGPAIQFPQ